MSRDIVVNRKKLGTIQVHSQLQEIATYKTE